MLELVLKEILNEQKETNLVNAQLAAYTKSLSDKMNDLDKRIGKMGNLTEPDHSKLLQQLQDHLDNIKSAIDAKPGEVTHKKIFNFSLPSISRSTTRFMPISLNGLLCLALLV
jgi:hypothetical protein